MKWHLGQILILSLFVAMPVLSKEGNERIPSWLSVEKKGEFSGGNWTSPDLFRWKLLIGTSLSQTIVDDREGVVARGKSWSCSITKPIRSQWPMPTGHGFHERRDIICAGGGFEASISVSSILNFKGDKVDRVVAEDSYIHVADRSSEGMDIGLRGEVWVDENQDGKQEEGEWKHSVDSKIP